MKKELLCQLDVPFLKYATAYETWTDKLLITGKDDGMNTITFRIEADLWPVLSEMDGMGDEILLSTLKNFYGSKFSEEFYQCEIVSFFDHKAPQLLKNLEVAGMNTFGDKINCLVRSCTDAIVWMSDESLLVMMRDFYIAQHKEEYNKKSVVRFFEKEWPLLISALENKGIISFDDKVRWLKLYYNEDVNRTHAHTMLFAEWIISAGQYDGNTHRVCIYPFEPSTSDESISWLWFDDKRHQLVGGLPRESPEYFWERLWWTVIV